MMKNALTLKQVREAVPMADSIGRTKDGAIMIRRGFFYTNGYTAEKFAERIKLALEKADLKIKILDSGEVWKAFRGSASTANSSHWFVKVAAI